MDGTIYIAGRLFDYTNAFLDTLERNGIKRLFLTNNSSLSNRDYLKKLRTLGVHALDDDVYTSADATKVYLKTKGYTKIYLMATPSLEEEFASEGFVLTKESPHAVVLAFDKTLNYEKMVIANNLLMQNIPFIATHPDMVCPYEPYPIPDTGSMLKLFKGSSGRDAEIIGKPSVHMCESIIEKYGFKREEIAMVGDRLTTDIRFGKENNILSILVFSGETTPQMLAVSEVKPDLVFESIKELGDVL